MAILNLQDFSYTKHYHALWLAVGVSCLHICISVVNMVVVGLVLGQSLMVVPTSVILSSHCNALCPFFLFTPSLYVAILNLQDFSYTKHYHALWLAVGVSCLHICISVVNMVVVGLVLGQSVMVVPTSVILSSHCNALWGLLLFAREVLHCLQTFEHMSAHFAISLGVCEVSHTYLPGCWDIERNIFCCLQTCNFCGHVSDGFSTWTKFNGHIYHGYPVIIIQYLSFMMDYRGSLLLFTGKLHCFYKQFDCT